MVYAPIIIPTCNRIEHMKRCINSLAKNEWAQYTELFISQDYPPEERFFNGYKELYDYLDSGITGFKEVHIYHQKTNLGPNRNENFLIRKISQKYDRYILSEDDNEFSPNFIEYMDKGLEIYKDDSDVISICAATGLNERLRKKYKEWSYVKQQRISPYGMGLWSEKVNNLKSEITQKLFDEIIHSINLQWKMWNTNGSALMWIAHDLMGEIPAMRDAEGNIIPLMDYNLNIYCIAKGKYSICPMIPLVKNWGFDGTGVNCAAIRQDTEVRKALIDKNQHFFFEKKDGRDFFNKEINCAHARFADVSLKEFIRSMIIIWGKMILNSRLFHKLIIYINRK